MEKIEKVVENFSTGKFSVVFNVVWKILQRNPLMRVTSTGLRHVVSYMAALKWSMGVT